MTLVAMTFEEASRWIASQEARIRELQAALDDKSQSKQYGALVDRIKQYAAGNITGCGTCTTIINEIRSFELETKAECICCCDESDDACPVHGEAETKDDGR